MAAWMAGPEQPRPLTASLHLPDPEMAALGARLGIPVGLGVAVPNVPGINEGLAVLHEGEVEVHAADHLGHQTAVAIAGGAAQIHR